jgi:gamma-glutamylaminecyclotransferase
MTNLDGRRSQMKMRVFVYGTLKRGFPNHWLMKDGGGKYRGIGRTLPEFTMISLGVYPGVVPGGETSIRGEIYDVDKSLLDQLDHLEGHPTFYQRVQVVLEDQTHAWMYLLPQSFIYVHNKKEWPVVESGQWTK